MDFRPTHIYNRSGQLSRASRRDFTQTFSLGSLLLFFCSPRQEQPPLQKNSSVQEYIIFFNVNVDLTNFLRTQKKTHLTIMRTILNGIIFRYKINRGKQPMNEG
ncbi:unnamed protein product [Cuscuta epithymum]|uniref:Uncharacterized protein n=1 Tax=Cuscuta epithymum TaxID=186058 RepID=A0AAV0F1F0_9ASTE|nr:unnamed protein product [Cuscuta epithymum]